MQGMPRPALQVQAGRAAPRLSRQANSRKTLWKSAPLECSGSPIRLTHIKQCCKKPLLSAVQTESRDDPFARLCTRRLRTGIAAPAHAVGADGA